MVLYLWRYIVPDALHYTENEPYFQCEKVIDDACSVIWCERYQEPGEISLKLRATPELLAFFWENEILISRTDTDRAMLVERVTMTTSAQEGDYIQITGKSAEGLTARRVIGQRGAITDENAANAVHYYMQENLSSYWYYHTDGSHQHGASNPYCRMYVNLLDHGEDDERITETVSAEPFGKNLGSFITEICKGLDFGFKVVFNGSKLTFSSYKGNDRTLNQSDRNAVVFSEDFYNLGDSEYNFSRESYCSYVLTGGSGTGSTREYGESFKNFRSASGVGINMRQKFINASGVSGNMLRIAAQNEVLSTRETISFSAEALTSTAFEYRKDYFLGDRVSVVNRYGINGTATVTEVVESEDENGYNLIPTLGMFSVQDYISPVRPEKPEPPPPPPPVIDPTKIAIFPLDDITHERLSDVPMYADNYSSFRDITRDDVKDHFELDHVNYVEVIFGDLCGATNSDIEIVYEGWTPSPSTPEPKLMTDIMKLTLNEGITRLVTYDDRISFPSNDYSLKEIFIPSTVTFITYNSGGGYNFFNTVLANPDVIAIKKPSGSITGAPWGATNATVNWTG